jgi:hypothetical protein
MSINDVPPGALLLDGYEEIEDAIFDGTGFHASESGPTELADIIADFTETGENVVFADATHDEYVELIIRIPRV